MTSRPGRPFRGISCALVSSAIVLSIASPRPTLAQEARGVVVAEPGGEPITGALVELLNENGQRVDAVLAGEDGAFRLRAPRAGSHAIRVQRIGFRTWTFEPLVLDGTMTFRFEVPVQPISLARIDVEAERRCRTDPDEALRAWALYEEAVPLLEPIVWAETEGLYVYQVRVEESVPEYVRGRPVSEDFLRMYPQIAPADPQLVNLRAPVATLTPAALAEEGYVQTGDGGSLLYYSPTAATLVSAEFLDTHCLTPATNDVGWEGVAFEPVRGRDTPDIEGVLWMDRSAGELRALEFRFTRVREMLEEHQMPLLLADVHERLERDPRVDDYIIQLGAILMDGEFGGRLEFEPTANGAWITRRWDLTIPILERHTQLLWRERPARVEGNPVAMQKVRRGEVTGVMAPRSYVDTMASSGGDR